MPTFCVPWPGKSTATSRSPSGVLAHGTGALPAALGVGAYDPSESYDASTAAAKGRGVLQCCTRISTVPGVAETSSAA